MPRKSKKADAPVAESVETTPQAERPEAVSEAGESPTIANVDPGLGVADDAIDDAIDDVVVASGEQAVTFTLEGQLYGLPIEVVQEIQQLVQFTPLPDTAHWLVGLIDIRGSVIPAIDLRALLGIATREFTLETPMVFCRVRGHVVCLIVDGVEDVVDIPVGGLQPPTSLYSMADRMIGMVRLPQGLVLMLDIDRLVPDAAIAVAEASEGGE